MNRVLTASTMLVLSCCLLAAEPKFVAQLSGKIVNVVDGDTVTLKTDTSLISVRIEGIDAPEKGQDFGTKSKDALKSLVTGKDIVVRKTGVDKYGRTLGRVFADGKDVSPKMVEDGWAWHFKKYSDDEVLAKAETEARNAKRGLWADPTPLAPWDFRERQKTVVAVPPPVVSSPAKPVETTAEAAPTKAEAKYWLNTSSGTRHNSRCQHFNNTKKGRLCSRDEGKACGQCGG